MSSEATLIIDGQAHSLPLGSGRFTIGRSPDNDLFIDQPGLSRRHALIESFDGIVQISDCGSRNGTFVNDAQVTGAVVLHDGDEVSLGDGCTLTVHLKPGGNGRSSGGRQRGGGPLSERREGNVKSGARLKGVTRADFNGGQPVLSHRAALVAGLAILLILAPAAILLRGRIANRSDTTASLITKKAESANNAHSQDDSGPAPVSSAAIESTSKEEVESAARQVLKQISDDDQSYEFPSEALADISARVDQYRGSRTLTDAMEKMAPDCERIAAQARTTVDPGLVVFTGMTEAVIAGQGRSPVQAAERCLPVMTDIWKLLGNRSADDALLLIAAYRMGPVTNLDRSGKKSHPMLPTLRKISQGVSSKRTVWYLYKNGGIEKSSYDFVVSFLAVAVLSEHPKEFGVSASPLVF